MSQCKFLGTRRLRLYVAAYLRGLLKPYYDQGTLSIVREELILDALSAEMDRDMDKQVLAAQTAMAAFVRDKKDYFKKIYNHIYEFRRKLEYSVKEVGAEEGLTKDPEVIRLTKMYKRMEESGELDEIEKIHDEIEKAHEQSKLEGYSVSQRPL